MKPTHLSKNFLIRLSYFNLFLGVQSSFGLTIEPFIHSLGQALRIHCEPAQDSECLFICRSKSDCEIIESYCRNCAGTHQLKLKRILDEVGITLKADETILSNQDLLKILVSGNFITLHSRTIFNYTSVYNGDQINAQFQALCPGSSDSNGLLMIETDSETHQIGKILGAICTNETTRSSEFRNIRINRFTYTP